MGRTWTSPTMTRAWDRGASRGGGDPRGAGDEGFTLMELLAVVFIIGVSLALILPNLDRITPKHRLRAAAREVAATIELCRHQSVTRAATYGLLYELEGDDTSTYRIILPEDDLGDRLPLAPRVLPEGIVLRAIVMPGNERMSTGQVEIDFSPTGELGDHIVILENEAEQVISVRFQALVGMATFSEGEGEFREFQGGI